MRKWFILKLATKSIEQKYWTIYDFNTLKKIFREELKKAGLYLQSEILFTKGSISAVV